jgi:hypothetical protein
MPNEDTEEGCGLAQPSGEKDASQEDAGDLNVGVSSHSLKSVSKGSSLVMDKWRWSFAGKYWSVLENVEADIMISFTKTE